LPGGMSAEGTMRSIRGDGEFSGATGSASSEIYKLTGGLGGGSVPSPQLTDPLKLPSALSPVLSPSIPPDFLRALQQATERGQTTISPTINIPITVNGDQKVGESIKKQVEPRLENVIQQMVNLSRN
jgi:hypothetical protein